MTTESNERAGGAVRAYLLSKTKYQKRNEIMIHLPDNPTQFDYLHAIRAIAARRGQELHEIYLLADEAMQIKWKGKCPEEQEAIDALNKDSILSPSEVAPMKAPNLITKLVRRYVLIPVRFFLKWPGDTAKPDRRHLAPWWIIVWRAAWFVPVLAARCIFVLLTGIMMGVETAEILWMDTE